MGRYAARSSATENAGLDFIHCGFARAFESQGKALSEVWRLIGPTPESLARHVDQLSRSPQVNHR
jgi:hypothetical protein